MKYHLVLTYSIKRPQLAIKEAREAQIAAVVPLSDLSDFSSDDKIGDMEHITLGDDRRFNNLDEVVQRFQLENSVFFDIKNVVLTTLKENKFPGKESKYCNAHITYFL